ncbi:8570_t:CDS:1, partial [Scutellospora calospora]
LETVKDEDWDLLIWISSQMSWEIYAYLFVVIWNTIGFGDDRTRDFKEETTRIISLIRKLSKNMCIDQNKTKKLIRLFEDYKYYRLDGSMYIIRRKDLVELVMGRLESHGLKHTLQFSQQLRRLSMKQKEKLRTVILERMEALVDIARPDDKLISEKDDASKYKNKKKNALLEQITELQKENSKYQAAYGNLINLGFSDEDPNNIANFHKDINGLQDLLDDFTLISGPENIVDVIKCNELLLHYKCNVEVKSEHGIQVLSAALQRLTIEMTITEINNYFNANGSTVEVKLMTLTKEIVDTTNSFAKEYAGTNEIANAIPIKIRQQVHAMLGCYAFSKDNHSLLVKISELVLTELNQYRKVTDDGNEIIPIIRKIIQLFIYRLQTHSTIPTYKFYNNGDKINYIFRTRNK